MTRDEPILTVSALTRQIRGVLDASFGQVWVQGEISQPRRPGSGHVYLTLKDEDAVLPAVIWRSTVARLRFEPEDGQEVIARGGIDVYPPQGRYQLIIRDLQPVGEGALRLAFEQLRAKLDAEGLFDPARKRALPAMPRRIALVTSRTGAAVRDMVTVIQRRFPAVVILLVPVRVQGEGAAREIAHALAFADTHAQADVIIAGRGGGSLEDLWAFNEEVVARAIHACATPVVSAVGHETDTTIADLVADVRAATPSQAGELVVPVRDELVSRLDSERRQLAHRMGVRLARAWQRLEALGDRPVLRRPQTLVAARARTLEHLEHRMRAPQTLVAARARTLEHLEQRMRARSPARRLVRRRETVDRLAPRLAPPLRRRLEREREALAATAAALLRSARRAWEQGEGRLDGLRLRLRALSPLAVLGRGYSLTRRSDDDRVVRGADDVAAGDRLRTRLGDGSQVDSRVERVEPGEDA